MKVIFCIVLAVVVVGCSSSPQKLIVDSFEGEISSDTVDYGASEGSSVEVSSSPDEKVHGAQSLKIVYDLKPSGYMWVARGYNLDVSRAAQWTIVPSQIPWDKYNAFNLFMYGSGSNGVVAFDVKDSQGEIWRFLLDDDHTGWKEISCPFSLFFPRKDWQPDNAQINEVLDFPIMSFQFEPRLPGKSILYFDEVSLIKLKEKD